MASNYFLPSQISGDTTATAIHLLYERGYDSTSVDDLADMLQISRSTFFRRWGTKEDIVFADHTLLLNRLREILGATEGDAFEMINTACLTVLKYHVSRPAATLERRALLRSNPPLRERELVMAHRYEREFRGHLTARLAESEERGWVSSAYAAGAVAIHNDALRAWFADQTVDAIRILQADLDRFAHMFRAYATPASDGVTSRVVVTLYEANAPIDKVMANISAALTPLT